LKYDTNYYDNKLPGGNELIKKLTTPGRFENGVSHGYGFGLFMQNLYNNSCITHGGAFPGNFYIN
jgi:hypothetical protein